MIHPGVRVAHVDELVTLSFRNLIHAVLIKLTGKEGGRVINKQGNYHDTVNANSFYPIRVQYSIGLRN